ncbi:MAG: 30S ribosomal protein S13 [Planctomycetota bacterium]|jgi:small subunit ribosomal protein S13|nr:30S ribosomal protein S13 [Planctomycetota bacterium]MDG1404748.1 30S ribosomal protein S13 [Planctomycetota bacterium]MDG2310698.1 30S ribosomal protein S13 [Planctomycetota bacterium]
MPRLIGVDIPADKRTVIALTYLYGIGRATAEQLCETLDLDPSRRAKEITDEELAKLAAYLQEEMEVEGSLRRRNTAAINRLREIACYRGLRHRRGLPVRGQRTKTNARSRKGSKKTVAGKASVKSLKG